MSLIFTLKKNDGGFFCQMWKLASNYLFSKDTSDVANTILEGIAASANLTVVKCTNSNLYFKLLHFTAKNVPGVVFDLSSDKSNKHFPQNRFVSFNFN
mgnify:CR=1 FL=1